MVTRREWLGSALSAMDDIMRIATGLLLGALLAPVPALAQSAAHHSAAPTARAVPVTEPIRVDGVLDEGIWASAPAVTSFTQSVPTEGAPASERMEIRFVYSDVALYIGARMYDSHSVTTRLVRRDGSMSASDP